MNSRERILGALKGEDIDYAPFVIEWNVTQKLHEKLAWNDERERLALHVRQGWDAEVRAGMWVSLSPEVTVRRDITDGIITQKWETPAVTLNERLRLTDDWDQSELSGRYLGLASDFRTTRYITYPFKNERDLDALPYIFPIDSPSDLESLTAHYHRQRKLADEFGFPLIAHMDAGMDWLFWLFPLEDAIYRAVDDPGFIHRILDQINAAKYKRLELLLSLGVDAVARRGWYEGADIWSPELLARFAWPAVKKEAELARGYGAPYIYIIDTGFKAIAKELAALPIDCILGADPGTGEMTMREIKSAFPDISLWGGLSARRDFAAETPDAAAAAIEEAIGVYGKHRLILGMSASYRHYYPWANFEAAERAWKRLRK